MKPNIFRSFLLVILVLLLFVSMTGCEDLDYRDAIRLYNDGDYEAAAEIFYALGDFEKCPELYTDCQYWIAVDLAEEGNFEKALPRFWKLGDTATAPNGSPSANIRSPLRLLMKGNLRTRS